MILKRKVKRFLTKLYFSFKEKKFKGRLKYLYEYNNSDTLIVIFSGFSDTPVYNYVKSLKDIKANKMFVLDDFGYRGSYYWYENGTTMPQQLVTALIQQKISGVKRIITLGSSKGGTCAIYYGLMFGATDIYAGACQYKVGTYLNVEAHKKIFTQMMGKEASVKEQCVLDDMLPKQIRNSQNSDSIIHLLYSKKEHTYSEHIKFLIDALEENGITHIDKIENFPNHNDVGRYFSTWIKTELKEFCEK